METSTLFKMATTLAEVLSPPPQRFVACKISTIPQLNLPFFDRTTYSLQLLGFDVVADVELRKGPPASDVRSQFMRYCYRAEDATGAAIYQIDAPEPSFPLKWLYQLTKNWPTLARVIELETEFSSERWITTSNGQNIFEPPPEVSAAYGIALPIDELFKTHMVRVTKHREAAVRDHLVPVGTIDALNEKEERVRSARLRFRNATLGLTDNELKAVLGNRYGELKERLVTEIERVRGGQHEET